MYNVNSTGAPNYNQSEVPLPSPDVWPSHPWKNTDNHEQLLQYIQARMTIGMTDRDARIPRLVKIDKDIAGWIKLSEEDRLRESAKAENGKPVALEQNLPISFIHIDDMMTYYAQTFAPSRGMFYHTADSDDADQSAGIVALMNNQAIYSGYYRQVLLGILSVLKYNDGGFTLDWVKENGPKIVRDESSGQDRVTSELRWEGNKMRALDMYNVFVDPTTPLPDIHKDGEFCATAEMRGFYWLQNKASQGIFYNVQDALKDYGEARSRYYRSPPSETQLNAQHYAGTNWDGILAGTPGGGLVPGFELVTMYIRINPVSFGLIKGDKKAQALRNRYEIWRFVLLNDKWIIDATFMNNVHNMLPFWFGHITDDAMNGASKSPAEILSPLQDFASFLMNIHIKGSRSAVFGKTYYDPTMVDMSQVPPGEVSANIPIMPAGQGRDVRTMVYHDRTELDTKQTIQDMGGVIDMIERFFPAQALPGQIAGIDRAVSNQVAAVQQGANRRQQKGGRLLDDMIFRPMRFAMYYNIIQYQPDSTEIVDFFTGKAMQIDLGKLRMTNLPFIIGMGLKALDRQAAADSLQKIIFALIQAPQAAQQIDLLALIDYWTSMIDIDINFKKFIIKQVQTPQGTQTVDSSGNAIAPATDPSAVTEPIRG